MAPSESPQPRRSPAGPVRVQRRVLADALKPAVRATAERGAMPVLSCVRLSSDGRRLVASGTDLDLAVSTSVEVGGSPLEAVVPAKLLERVVGSLPEDGQVELSVEGTALVVRLAGRRAAAARLRMVDPDEWPRGVAEPLEGEATEVPLAVLAAATTQVAAAASTDGTRPTLGGVSVDVDGDGALRFAATDSYRLHTVSMPGRVAFAGDGALIPARALRELTAAVRATYREATPPETVEVRVTDRQVQFTIGSVTVTARLLEGDFPSWEALVPAPEAATVTVTVSRKRLVEAVRSVQVMLADAAPVRLIVHDTGDAAGVTVEAVQPDVGDMRVQIPVGEDCEVRIDESATREVDGGVLVAFNPAYLAAAVDCTEAERVRVGITDQLKPALVVPATQAEDRTYTAIVMPVRITNG